MDLEDADRVAEEARRGDSDALVGLCKAFHAKILKYMQDRADAASAQDLTAQVVLKAVENIHRQKGSFRAWIFRIARNVVIDEASKRKVRPEQPPGG